MYRNQKEKETSYIIIFPRFNDFQGGVIKAVLQKKQKS